MISWKSYAVNLTLLATNLWSSCLHWPGSSTWKIGANKATKTSHLQRSDSRTSRDCWMTINAMVSWKSHDIDPPTWAEKSHSWGPWGLSSSSSWPCGRCRWSSRGRFATHRSRHLLWVPTKSFYFSQKKTHASVKHNGSLADCRCFSLLIIRFCSLFVGKSLGKTHIPPQGGRCWDVGRWSSSSTKGKGQLQCDQLPGLGGEDLEQLFPS